MCGHSNAVAVLKEQLVGHERSLQSSPKTFSVLKRKVNKALVEVTGSRVNGWT